MYGEPRAETAARIEHYRRLAASHGRKPAFNVSFRPIIAETEGKAWDKARGILSKLKGRSPVTMRGSDKSAERLLEIASRGDVHDERLWMPIVTAAGALGNTTCLVGTSEQVAAAIAKYYDLGVDSFLIRGFDPLADAREFGRELIPRIRAATAEKDRPAAG